MDYLERYIRGEFEEVWSELQALGEGVRSEPVYSQARDVADETMRRVRRNLERLVGRLQSMAYAFGLYPDGSPMPYNPGALTTSDDASRRDLATLQEAVGPLPISLVSFWEQVGSVNLMGMLRAWPQGLDPLVVDPPEGALSDLNDRGEIVETIGHFEAGLAPDYLHKDNISGGSPYAVKLPDPSIDFLLRNEKHDLFFVSYLRLAILHFGGFPGLEGGDAEFDALPRLLEGLEPF